MEIWNKEHDFMSLGRRAEIGAESIGVIPLLKAIMLKEKGHLSEIHEEGIVADDNQSGMTYINKIDELKGRLIYKFISETYIQCTYLFEDGLVEVSVSNKTYYSIHGYSYNEEFVTALQKSAKELFLPTVQHGHVFAIVYQGNRLMLSSIGAAGIPLNKHNYTDEVSSSYDFIVQDLNSAHPSGRIAILEGEPGTGKTHLIRALLLDVPQAMFVLVSPDMVTSLSGPELLPLLLAQKQSYALHGPIILILEDADKCLVTRASDNVASIQALLNLGDGILGSLLDLRIVATTNAKKLDIEGAILRPGRLSKRVEVGPLDYGTAINVFKHLLPNAEVPSKFVPLKKYTLAEVYAFARESGWLPDEQEEKKTNNVLYDNNDEGDVDYD